VRPTIYAALAAPAVLAVWLGMSARPAGPPRVQVAPVAAADGVAAGSSTEVVLRVTLPKGLHVNANKPRDPYLVPIVLTVDPAAGVTVTEIVYPTPIDLEQQGAPEPLAVYEREFRIVAVLSVSEDVAPGEIVVPARLRYQACDERMCYIPATATTSWTLRILRREDYRKLVMNDSTSGISMRFE
jgi:thiol:disulfide interchange protein DsbD